MATIAEQKKVEKFLEEWETIPMKYCDHYEVECDDNAEAENLAYLISDGMGPMVETEVEGKKLYFRNDLFTGLLEKSDTDFAKIVSEWPGMKSRVKFVGDTLKVDFETERQLKELASKDGFKRCHGHDRGGVHHVVLEGKEIVVHQDGMVFDVKFRGGKYEIDWLMPKPDTMAKKAIFATTQGMFKSTEDLYSQVKEAYPAKLKEYRELVAWLAK